MHRCKSFRTEDGKNKLEQFCEEHKEELLDDYVKKGWSIGMLKEKWWQPRPGAVMKKLKDWGVYRNIHNIGTTARQQRIKDTCMKRYNVTNPAKLSEVKEKVKQTSIIRYGAANVYASEYFKDLRWIKGKDHIENIKEYGEYTKQIDILTKNNVEYLENCDFCYYTKAELYIPGSIIHGKKIHYNFPWARTIDHKISKKTGFINGLSAEMISSVSNLCYCSRLVNCAKQELNEEDFINSDTFKRLMIYENTKGRKVRSAFFSV
jgi:hypothetical protein